MAINFQRVLFQILLILIFIGVKYLNGRFFRGRKRRQLWWSMTTALFFILAFWNFGWYWSAYPIIVWMVLALALIVVQVAHNHEFIYRRYWPPFWRCSMYLAVISFACSIFAGFLPLI